MATFADIRTVRLAVGDPPGVIALLEVAVPEDLPPAPGQQTAYRVQSTGRYMYSEKEDGAVLADYEALELLLSDAQVSQLITTYGIEDAPCRAYGVIASRLGSKLRISSMSTGSESTTYTPLRELYEYYKRLAEDCVAAKNAVNLNTTGRYGATKQPEVAGGNV